MHGGLFPRHRAGRPASNRFNVLRRIGGRRGTGFGWRRGRKVALSDSGRSPSSNPPIRCGTRRWDRCAWTGNGAVWAGTFSAKACGASGGRSGRALHHGPTGFPSDAVGARFTRTPDGNVVDRDFRPAWPEFRSRRPVLALHGRKTGLLSDKRGQDHRRWRIGFGWPTTRGISRLWKSQLREFAAGPAEDAGPVELRRGGWPAQCAMRPPGITRLARVGSACARAAIGPDCARHGRSTIHGPDRTPGSRRGGHVVEITAGGAPGDLSRRPDWRRARTAWSALHRAAISCAGGGVEIRTSWKAWTRTGCAVGSPRLTIYNSLPARDLSLRGARPSS